MSRKSLRGFKFGKLYSASDAVPRPAVTSMYDSSDFGENVGFVGYCTLTEPFVLLERVELPEGSWDTYKVLTVDGMLGWIDVPEEWLEEVVF